MLIKFPIYWNRWALAFFVLCYIYITSICMNKYIIWRHSLRVRVQIYLDTNDSWVYTCHHQSWPYMCGVGSRKQQRVLLVVSLWCLVASAMASLPKIEEEEGGVLLRAGAAILHLMIDEPIYIGLFTSTLTGYGRHTTSKDSAFQAHWHISSRKAKKPTLAGRRKWIDRRQEQCMHALLVVSPRPARGSLSFIDPT